MPRMTAAQRLAQAGGRARSPAKTRAARANGRKGGRPRIMRPCRVCERPTTDRSRGLPVCGPNCLCEIDEVRAEE